MSPHYGTLLIAMLKVQPIYSVLSDALVKKEHLHWIFISHTTSNEVIPAIILLDAINSTLKNYYTNHFNLSIDKPLIIEISKNKSINRKKVWARKVTKYQIAFSKATVKAKLKHQKFKKKKNQVVRKLKNWNKLKKVLCKLDR